MMLAQTLKREQEKVVHRKHTHKNNNGDNKDKAKTGTHGQTPKGSLLFKSIHIKNTLVGKTRP